ncbi:8685_t:CDS:2 [Funneliformis caledonium]|uniref:8685_t:CDS:1 n=1 Tax=Funneliformis caledonium TaxID=1117310 RepID=A0A9N9E192_9GLOM|nr:8685_t:CDS:2 [Funneliformis caledonium]
MTLCNPVKDLSAYNTGLFTNFWKYFNNIGVEGINENETNQDKEDGGDNRSAKLPKLMSSVEIGKELEELIVAILESLNVEKGGRGDKGKDISHCYLMNLRSKKKGPSVFRELDEMLSSSKDSFFVKAKGTAVVREMDGVLSKGSWPTNGVVVGLSKDAFTCGAVKAAK